MYQGVGGRKRASAGRTAAGRRWISHAHDDDTDDDDYSVDYFDHGGDDDAGQLVAGEFLRFGSKFILAILWSFSSSLLPQHSPISSPISVRGPIFLISTLVAKILFSFKSLFKDKLISSQFLITGATELPWAWWSSSGGLTSAFLSWKAICLWQFLSQTQHLLYLGFPLTVIFTWNDFCLHFPKHTKDLLF